MRKSDDPRIYKLISYLNQQEYNNFLQQFATSTCQSHAEFFRNRLVGYPETVIYRDGSLDDYLKTAIALKAQLGEALMALKKACSDLRDTPLAPQLELLEVRIFTLGNTVEEIKTLMNKIYDQCMRRS